MKFEPRQPEEGINVSDTHPLKELALLITGVVGCALILFLVLGFVAELMAPRVPVAVELAVFGAWDELMSDALGYSTDADQDEQVARVRSILDRLSTHWPDDPYEHTVGIIETSSVNALAVPGGTIAVTTGLLDEVESDGELAFVLAHELGHFKNRDHMRRLGRGLSFTVLLVALGFGGNSDASGLVGYAQRAASLGFDRDQELDADRFGCELVAKEYGQLAGGIRFFERLTEEHGNRSRWSEYTSTHPATDRRIERIRALAEQHGWATDSTLEPEPATNSTEP